MKINRYKKVHKTLRFYSNNFGFRKPYQVLIDGTICVAALKQQINIQEQFTKYLDGSVKLLTTQCIMEEVEKLGPATFGALLIIKKFGIHKCGHGKSPVLASDCILDMLGEKNTSRYIVATQDRDLQEKCRQIEGVPLLYLHSKTPTLESPSLVTQDVATAKSSANFQISESEKRKLTSMKNFQIVEEGARRKRKKKGGPNPLSCKRKKKSSESNLKSLASKPKKRKRSRSRCRLTKKIKNELLGLSKF